MTPPTALDLPQLLAIADNRRTFDRLAKQASTSLGVIPFVGAGLSIPCGMPGWSDFLTTVAPSSARPRVAELLQENAFEEAAELAATELGARAFLDRLEDTFAEDRATPRGAVLRLPTIARGPVFTTNFDHVLETVFAAAERHFEARVWGEQSDMFGRALHADQRYLIKLHGDLDERNGRVLTLSEYEKHYGSREPSKIDLGRALPALLHKAFSSRTLLFLGCSLGPDRTVKLLRQVAESTLAPPHYAICERPDPPEDDSRAQFLSTHNVRPLWFPKGRFEAIDIFLEALQKRAAPVTTVPGPARRLSPATPDTSPSFQNLSEMQKDSAKADGRPFVYAVLDPPGEHIVYRGTDARAHQLAYMSGSWRYIHLQKKAAANIAVVGNPVGYFFPWERGYHVVFLGHDDNVYELYSHDIDDWTVSNLRENIDVPPFRSSLSAYAFNARKSQHVFGAATNDGVLHEICWGQWGRGPLRFGSPSPPCVGTPAVLVDEEARHQHLFYRSHDGSLHELFWYWDGSPTGRWETLPVSSSPPYPPAMSDPTATVSVDKCTQFLTFIGPDDRIHRLHRRTRAIRSDSGELLWTHREVKTTSAIRPQGALSTFVLRGSETHHVVFHCDGEIYEFWCSADEEYRHRRHPVPVRPQSAPQAYCLPTGSGVGIVYCGTDHSIWALRWEQG